MNNVKSSEILLSLQNRTLEVSKDINEMVIVHYKGAEVKYGICLHSICGRGMTFEDACDDYLSQIRGKTLVFDACTDHRKEVIVLG